MSSTDKTEALGLSQFLDNDKPTWRGDYNGDMRKIDLRAAEDTTKFNSMEIRIKKAEDTGIIPAYAGSTQEPIERRSTMPDHPRIRGEHSNAALYGRSWSGSSPHTRGARVKLSYM